MLAGNGVHSGPFQLVRSWVGSRSGNIATVTFIRVFQGNLLLLSAPCTWQGHGISLASMSLPMGMPHHDC